MQRLSSPTSNLAELFDQGIPGETMLLPLLDGSSPAEILVDDPNRPSRCVVRSTLGLTFASHDVDQDFLDEALSQLRRTGGVGLIDPGTESSAWKAQNRDAVIERLEFRQFDPTAVTYRQLLSVPIPSTEIREISPPDFDRCLWKDMLLAFCGSRDGFFQHGFGLSLVRDAEILAEAYAPLLAKGTMEIGVITAEEHRGKGYAKQIAAHLIKRCLDLNRQVAWSCEADNPTSAAIARHLGFHGERTYSVYAYQSVKSS